MTEETKQEKIQKAICANLGITEEQFAASAMKVGRFTSDPETNLARRREHGTSDFGINARMDVSDKGAKLKAAHRHVAAHMEYSGPTDTAESHLKAAREALMSYEEGDDPLDVATKVASHALHAVGKRVMPVSVDAASDDLD